MTDEASTEDTVDDTKLIDRLTTVFRWPVNRIAAGIFRVMNWLEKPPDYEVNWTTSGQDNQNEQDQMFRELFQAAFWDRLTTYLLPVFAIVIVLVGDVRGYWTVNPQGYGLLLDLVGAIGLALGLFRGTQGFNSDVRIFSGGSTTGATDRYYDRDSARSEARKTADAVFGTVFLTIGFTVQLLAVTGLL